MVCLVQLFYPGYWFNDEEYGFEEEYYPDYQDIFIFPIPITIGVLFFRYFLKKYCFCRLGLSFGLKPIRIKKPTPNIIFENAFQQKNKWNHKDIVGLAKQTASTERQVERWLRLRQLQYRSSNLYKFSENCWRCFFFLNIMVFGLTCLWSKSWFWDLDLCWKNFPNLNFTGDVWWFYIVSISYYWSAIVNELFDYDKREFWQSFLHNLIAVSILSFLWINNMYRISSIVLLFHGLTNVFLCASKATKYIKMFLLSKELFIVFLLIWIATRLYYYPFLILHGTIYRAPQIVAKVTTSYYIFQFLLTVFLIVEFYWIYKMLKMSSNKYWRFEPRKKTMSIKH